MRGPPRTHGDEVFTKLESLKSVTLARMAKPKYDVDRLLIHGMRYTQFDENRKE